MIPSYVLKNIQDRGAEGEKRSAKHSLLRSAKIRNNRLAPIPQPRVGTEDRIIYDARNTTKLPGYKVQEEQDPVDPDQAVNEAFDGAGNTYRLFFEVLGRESYDDKDAQIISTVHYDRQFDNAFWDGSQMVYGDGHFFNPFTRDLTVIGHELTHAVTQFSANLDYEGQAGALNEHISDVFGAIVEQYAYQQGVDQATWLIGALLCEGKIKGRALRDMLNPGTAYDDPVIGKDPQPAHMDQYVRTSEDYGGVHINSGIPNRAFAIACKNYGKASWDAIGSIWYKTLTEKIGSKCQFQEFANQTFLTAKQLYGDTSLEPQAVAEGWAMVGIVVTGDVPAPAPTPEPEPPGSPCMPLVLEILSNPDTVKQIVALGANPQLRRFVAQLYRAMRDQ